MVICAGTDGYQIRQVGVTCQLNRRNRVSNGGSMLPKPNRKQIMVWNNTYTLQINVGTFNIRYVAKGLILV
jgi:hypothetical protein